MTNHTDLSDSGCSSLERSNTIKDVKVVVVGQTKSGKTALVQRFVNNIFTDTYTPTGFEKYSRKYKVDNHIVQFSIWDTSGSEAYNSIRPLAYPDADVFLLCFDLADQNSFDLAINKWYPEIRMHCKVTPVILCGCKADVKGITYPDRISSSSLTSSTTSTVITEKPSHYKFTEMVTNEQIIIGLYTITAAAYVETSSLIETDFLTCTIKDIIKCNKNSNSNEKNDKKQRNNSKSNNKNSISKSEKNLKINYNNNILNNENNNETIINGTTTGVTEAFEIAAEAALGLLYGDRLSKNKKLDDKQSAAITNKSSNKNQIKNKLKGRSKNCCVM